MTGNPYNPSGDGSLTSVGNGSSVQLPPMKAAASYLDVTDVPTLYHYLKTADPKSGITVALGAWSDLAKDIGTINGQMEQALKDAKILSDSSNWKGPAADYFRDVANRIIQFGKRVQVTASFNDDNGYATFQGVSYWLNDWMSFIQQTLHDSPYTNSGRDWTAKDAQSYRFGNEQEYDAFMAYYWPIRRMYYQGDPKASQGAWLTWDEFQSDGQWNGDGNDPDGFWWKELAEYLSGYQRAFFETAATYTAQQYVQYGNALPMSPSPDDLPKKDTDSSGGGNGNGNFSPNTDFTPPTVPTSFDGKQALGDPGLTGVPTFTPTSPTSTPVNLNPTDGVIGGNGTSLAGFTPPGPLDGTGLNGLGSLGGLGSGLTTPGLASGLGGLSGSSSLGELGTPLGSGLGSSTGASNLLGEAAGAGTPAALAAEEAAAGATAGRGMGMFPPPMMGMGGQQQDRDRQRATYLTEDEEFWQVDRDLPPSVLGSQLDE